MNSIHASKKTLSAMLAVSLLATACDAGTSTGFLDGDAGMLGGSSSTGGGTAAGGRPGTGGAGATGTGGTIATDCNSVVNGAPTVSLAAVAQNPPAPTGGMIPNGTYYLTQMTQYTGPGGSTVPTTVETIQQTIVISSSSSTGAALQLNATASAQNLTIAGEMNGTITISGTTLTATMTCTTVATSGVGQAESYSIEGSQFLLYSGSTVPNVKIATYTLQ